MWAGARVDDLLADVLEGEFGLMVRPNLGLGKSQAWSGVAAGDGPFAQAGALH